MNSFLTQRKLQVVFEGVDACISFLTWCILTMLSFVCAGCLDLLFLSLYSPTTVSVVRFSPVFLLDSSNITRLSTPIHS